MIYEQENILFASYALLSYLLRTWELNKKNTCFECGKNPMCF